jgi:predicted metal-dependent hydrolase
MPVEIDQIVRSKRKTLAILIKNDGTLIVRAPMRTSQAAIQAFVKQHIAWIEKKQAEIRTVIAPARKQYTPGELFLFLGKPYPLAMVKDQRQTLVLEESFKLAESARDRAELAFERWYRTQARRILQERVDLFASQYAFQYRGIKITSAKTRWGSCSAQGSLNFSWRLILAPLEQVDYVVVHELVHTEHHNHSKRFWEKLGKIMPDFKQRTLWLRRNGQQLML